MTDRELRRLIERLSAPVPRYTSYPTAPHFHAGVDARTYERWLSEIAPQATLSLYLHVPYCDRLCWFCGCHTRHTLRYRPVADYLKALIGEIGWVGARLAGRGRVTAIHLGGGSPTMLAPTDLARLGDSLRHAFAVSPQAEISIEIDPNGLGADRIAAMAAFGLTRASVGVQDFDPRVQRAINRPQSFGQTRAVIDALRAHGVRSVNVDALYGLPHQTLASIGRTMGRVLALAPDRVALFGYAHVPWIKAHQRMIDEAALPGTVARFRQAAAAGARLVAAGMVPVGMDHFARRGDSLALAAEAGTLRRNFQGYTADDAEVLIGLGASAIGRLPQGYVQNLVATGGYLEAVRAGGGAVAKGFALGEDDRLRAHVIERLMCRFSVTRAELAARSPGGAALFDLAREIAAGDEDGLATVSGGTFSITDRGRPFVRSIAARFDAYLGAGTARHSAAV